MDRGHPWVLVDDETRARRPDVSGNRRGQHRRDDQIRIEPADPFPHHLIPQRELDRHLVAAIGKLDVHPLGHAVVATRNEQDPHVDLQCSHASPATIVASAPPAGPPVSGAGIRDARRAMAPAQPSLPNLGFGRARINPQAVFDETRRASYPPSIRSAACRSRYTCGARCAPAPQGHRGSSRRSEASGISRLVTTFRRSWTCPACRGAGGAVIWRVSGGGAGPTRARARRPPRRPRRRRPARS